MYPTALAETFCSFPPSSEEWSARRDIFTGLGLKLYNCPELGKLPNKFQAIERELERCYCSGSYFACIVLAQALVEVFFISSGPNQRDLLRNALSYISNDLAWLDKSRNDLLHFGRPANHISREEYTEARDKFESDARSATALVYHVARAFVQL